MFIFPGRIQTGTTSCSYVPGAAHLDHHAWRCRADISRSFAQIYTVTPCPVDLRRFRKPELTDKGKH
ncbi:hypothetical protein PTKU64_83080 [Paraburkholderia terrae]|uniref:Uncharacterized protein n=1 Tax=Paraburkholderia terrae TaxID=311230 RepID=A0ABN6JX94_9BURK|nr:hypothetical protein PTKU64_83080 [Paraburkholderia terrae]BDC45883.1 hypothetical protein PTKU15_91800 [Paraburkholderia terrae]